MASRARDQIDSEGAVLRSVRATVERHPSPPRPVDRVQVALSLYRGKAVKVLFFAALAAVLFAITFYTSGGPGTIWALRLVLGSCFLLFLLGPSRSTFTVARWMRDGLLATADVSEAHQGAWLKHPEVRGRRVVHHPRLGDFHDEFAVVAPWAPSVRQASRLEVLVAPSERKTWLTLGLAG